MNDHGFRHTDKWTDTSPLLLIRDGRLVRRNMKRRLISTDELMARLKKKGISTLTQVKVCFLDHDGEFSIVRSDRDRGQRRD